MPLNSLLGQAGLKLGPLVLETLVKHYLERVLKERGDGVTKLSQDELLYDEAFHIVKTFMEAAVKHTVEELQEFSNTRTPTPPWTHIVRLTVPMTCCDDAATYLIQALGGEEVTKRIVGGTKWWQVRGIRGIDAEWLTAKKDWAEAKRRRKAQQKEKGKAKDAHKAATSDDLGQEMPAVYDPEMDKMRCILYAHGGGYYFGSIDQERYSLERYARKINGRVFAINYRLAPQYPFPCALQDFLAAYLYLIRPPEGASHCPVNPAHIVVAGDSAGGGLSVSLLQVIRDSGLPMPAGAVLISPWCDMTHSFPSIHTNTATDVLPPYGLSFHKPSTLWPPPPDELTSKMQDSIRSRVREVVHMGSRPTSPDAADRSVQDQGPGCTDHQFLDAHSGETLHLGSTASLPDSSTSVRNQAICLQTQSGEVLTIDSQLQMYTPNYLLTHPLVSSALSYLGGLPPLLVIVSEKEVLRDEIIYLAHKAAYPDKYRVKEETRKMYPALDGIEQRFGPTKVHLQVYDDAAHTLPTLFAFTTPAKYCYRAIATFCKYTTGMLPTPSSIISDDVPITTSPVESPSRTPDYPLFPQGHSISSSSLMPTSQSSSSSISDISPRLRAPRSAIIEREAGPSSKGNLRRVVSAKIHRASVLFQWGNGQSSGVAAGESSQSSDVAGPRFSTLSRRERGRTAGEPSVYDNGLDIMIRERISTDGTIRALEAEEELPALAFPAELIGVMSELVARRYFDGRAKFAKKFAKVEKYIEEKRQRNLVRAQSDTMRNMAHLQTFLSRDEKAVHRPSGQSQPPRGIQEGLMATGSWPWAWALDVGEEPPPSSIVARRDTGEARRLARIADQAFLADEHVISGNNLWSVLVEFLTKTPDKHNHGHKDKDKDSDPQGQVDNNDDLMAESKQERRGSKFTRFLSERRKGRGRDHSEHAKE
ncbi:uncharacterized protein FIBRA_01243 [Fibroporia radiculosa]|uniref:Alpha/beta hydrolase fold-3 domain-containing protein n=1 Tax=Fibroporia radiculosa TaxID=599839 RepID=J4G0V8_9APHY|nr:uncharacterized protein FIBRA_01243 [Fibroporia radiculosa]CCL99228.1 predicted protein [Fibroporia radiculosa]